MFIMNLPLGVWIRGGFYPKMQVQPPLSLVTRLVMIRSCLQARMRTSNVNKWGANFEFDPRNKIHCTLVKKDFNFDNSGSNQQTNSQFNVMPSLVGGSDIKTVFDGNSTLPPPIWSTWMSTQNLHSGFHLNLCYFPQIQALNGRAEAQLTWWALGMAEIRIFALAALE